VVFFVIYTGSKMTVLMTMSVVTNLTKHIIDKGKGEVSPST